MNLFNQSDFQKEIERIKEEAKYTRELVIPTYEEWKAYEEVPKEPSTAEEINQLSKM